MKRWPLAVWLLIGALPIALRLTLYLIYQPTGVEPDGLGMALYFWPDEPPFAKPAQWWAALQPKIAGYWPPLYPWLTAQMGRLIGDPLIGGRLVSALAADGLAVTIGLLCLLVTRHRPAAWLGGVLMAIAPLAVAWDVRVRPESLFAFLYYLAIFFLVRQMTERRHPIDLPAAVGLAGVAACVKFEAVVLLPALAVMAWQSWRQGDRRHCLACLPALIPWLLSAAWLWSQPDQARVGDYADLFSPRMLAQIPLWFAMTLAALPAVLVWPVFVLTAIGGYAMATERRHRPVLYLLLYLVAAHTATVAVGYNWTSRYLLPLVPALLVLAAVGWHRLPLVWLRAVMAGLVVAASLFLCQRWVAAERDRWRETIDVGRAVAAMPNAARTLWSDDPYLTPFWTGRDAQTLDDLGAVQPGDLVILHDLYGALRKKRTVEQSLQALSAVQPPTILFDTRREFTPLSGEVFDPHELAGAADLRAVGPFAFWRRTYPIAVRAVLIEVTAAPR